MTPVDVDHRFSSDTIWVDMPSRRQFLQQSAALSAAAGASLAVPAAALATEKEPPATPGFVDLRRDPDFVSLQTDAGMVALGHAGSGRWTGASSEVRIAERQGARTVQLAAPTTAVLRVRLRWRGAIAETVRVMGDAWERGYGELEWRGLVPDRFLPWYCATHDGARTHGYGVRTGPAAFCAWQVDADGITLWADVRSGGVPLQLGERVLDVCQIVARVGVAGESPFAALHALCRQLCPDPRMPAQPIYGHNDWYWAYGKNSAESVRADAHRIVELSPTGANRPFVVIDDGWQPGRITSDDGAGLWDRGNEKFPDMAGLTADIRAAGGRAGIWCRPLQAPADAPDNWRLSRDRTVLDPSVPAVLARVGEDVARMRTWGYELIKHDYSTWDIFGRWGFQMGSALTKTGWTFAEGPRRTTAEILDAFYATIRSAAGDGIVIGCNTVSHLSAGRFEVCRIGDDSSGTEWNRTRRMGINSLAFRAVQHGAFYAADPDCVGVIKGQPWSLNRQWLDLVARSGTMLMTSIAPDALGAAERRDVVAALALAAQPQPLGEPLDWQRLVYPSNWRLMGGRRTYDWAGPEGSDLP